MTRHWLVIGALSLSLALGGAVSAAEQSKPAPEPEIPPQARGVVLPAYTLKPGRMVDVGGHRLNLYCFGEGGPTVLMLSGGGWGAVAFAGIQQQLAAKTRVCSYDRAGAGFSDAGPARPEADQATRDLEALIKAASLQGPFVLVGWSAGGMEARAFAYRHTDQVAGLVTIDGSDFDYSGKQSDRPWVKANTAIFRECRDAAQAGVLASDAALYAKCRPAINPLDFYPDMRAAMAQRTLDPALYELQAYGMETLDQNAERLRKAHRDFGAMPLRVMVAGYHFPDPAHPTSEDQRKADQEFIFDSFTIASTSRDGRLIAVPGSGHGIHFDKAQVVIDVIEEVIGKVRAAP